MHNLYITTYQGLEEALRQEVVDLGIDSKHVQASKRGVRIADCSLEDVYRFNYELRLALRVLVNLSSFRIKSAKELQWRSKKVNWHQWFDSEKTFRVDAVVNNSREFSNSKYASQVTKDGIIDCFKNTVGERPNVDTYNPDVIIQVLISKDNVTLSLDSSGDSLHKRGYKTGNFRAPMSEVLAAGILKLLNYDGSKAIYDPMCGSGTILCEAFQIASNIPAGKYRDWWAFESWKPYREDDFLAVKEKASSKESKSEIPVYLGDRIWNNREMSVQNLKRLGCYQVEDCSQDFFKSSKPAEGGLLIMNPPYDLRLELGEAQEFYRQIGDQFKQAYSGWEAAVFSANVPALKALGLKPKRRIPLFNGPNEGRLFTYDLY